MRRFRKRLYRKGYLRVAFFSFGNNHYLCLVKMHIQT